MNRKWIKQYAIVIFLVLFIYFFFNPVSHSVIQENGSKRVNFEEAVSFVLKWEGGYTNDPNDPGGETKYGICKRSYPTLDIKNLTLDKAKEIYYQNYWLKAGCDELSPPLDIIVFDTAVNCGVGRAKEFLEISSDWKDYLLRRIAFYTELKTAKFYIRGWVNRVVDLYYSQKELNLISKIISSKIVQ